MEKALYIKLFNLIKSPVIITKDNEIFDINEAALHLFNITSKENLTSNKKIVRIINELLTTKKLKTYKKYSLSSDKDMLLEIRLKILDSQKNIYIFEFNKVKDESLYNEITLLSQHNREMFNNSPEAIAIINNKSIIIDINKSFEKIFGYLRYEAIGQDIDDLIVPKNQYEEAKGLFDEVLSGKRLNVTKKRKTKDNMLVDVNITSYPVKIDNMIKGNYIIYKDISEETTAKKLLKNNQAFQKQLFNHSLFPIAILDNKETILDINIAFENTFKYSKLEAIGKNIIDLIVPDNLYQESSNFKRRVLNKESFYEKTKRKDKYGNILHVEAAGSPVIIDNEVVGIFAMYKNIEAEVRTSKKLEKQKAYFEQLFYKSPEAIALLDNKNNIVDINKAFEQTFEYSLENIKGKHIDQFIVPKEFSNEAKSYSNYVLKTKKSLRKEAIRQSKSGRRNHFEILAYPILLDENNIGVYVIYKNISERIKKEKQIKKLAYRDYLTNCYNGKKFYQVVEYEINRSERYSISLSLIIFDLNDFKQINDTYGHLVGDEILKSIASIVQKNIRNIDYLFRWGGDEFVILLPQTTIKDARYVSNKIETFIKNSNFTQGIQLSISAGVSEYKKDLNQMLQKADQRMYDNKKLYYQNR